MDFGAVRASWAAAGQRPVLRPESWAAGRSEPERPTLHAPNLQFQRTHLCVEQFASYVRLAAVGSRRVQQVRLVQEKIKILQGFYRRTRGETEILTTRGRRNGGTSAAGWNSGFSMGLGCCGWLSAQPRSVPAGTPAATGNSARRAKGCLWARERVLLLSANLRGWRFAKCRLKRKIVSPRGDGRRNRGSGRK